ncbi:hypothetical protein F2Q68_00023442 [Brassica cretica]|uniref:Uncharacterized protein n=1 Tax=Brassica cretica TaxID=69181 RepID=A0A8S9G5N9_BRACR|nr:hypothetical protein F2Q68_00023442 [Brassica cretica]
MILANSTGSQTTKLAPVGPQDITGSRLGSSTKSKVLDRNGGIGFPCKMSSGMGSGEATSVSTWRGTDSGRDEMGMETPSFSGLI